MRLPTAIGLLSVSLMAAPPSASAQWQPKQGPLMTRWAAEVSAEAIATAQIHPEYPRPQMVRERWQNLNGLWSYAVGPKDAAEPADVAGTILVPFPIESALSGVMRRVADDERIWYRRTFDMPDSWRVGRVLLHFGASDWETTVWVDGKEVGTHRGGYDPFSYEIGDALDDRPEHHELLVAVWDPTSSGTQPRGKQINEPHGIWYTPTSGIWQTVWLEAVPKTYLASLRLVPDLDRGELAVAAEIVGDREGLKLEAIAFDGQNRVATAEGSRDAVKLVIENPRRWSPDSPFLYGLTIRLVGSQGTVDQVSSYFGMRKIALGKDDRGVTRLMLNDEPLFQFGPLDQGFWPDGLYTAPTDEALRYDIEVTKQLGFNMARKHVKVEPDRWYYWCDKLGLLVWQDMPNGDAHVEPGKGEITRSLGSAEQFARELKALIDARRNHPCIVMWVPFNEGWGQFETARIVDLVRSYDPTRLVNGASGWNDIAGVGDVHDIHIYPGPGSPDPEPARAAVLGEYGGLGLPVSGHTWQDEKNWGYRSYTNVPDLEEAYIGLLSALRPLIDSPGLAAAIYTQTTDVEIEVNGLMTYDRAIIKMDAERIAAANLKVYLPPPEVVTLVPTSRIEPQTWRFTTSDPGEGWYQSSYEAQSWREGPAGFGTEGTPGAVVRTEWNTPEIWLRRTLDLEKLPPADADLHLLIHHDEDAEVYLNGQRVLAVTGYTTGYVPLPLGAAAKARLRQGENTLAVHCKQTGGGQYIDVGLVELRERK